ncbi:fungal specific transcription factor [Colletotrichum musicola]|uniref:Fungal specific transcription factor n=1 Tax=Colletotrichum musicola TaxID=2175873 RepID=A0A8H6K0J7_9PEZI|nr:fungal specific transcription factor [Colletotrichum musicola]
MGAGRDLRYFGVLVNFSRAISVRAEVLTYLGSSSAIALLRSQPSLPEQSPTARANTDNPDSEAGPWSLWTHPRLQPVLDRRTHCPLPSWNEALSLVSAFFDQEHMALPLFHPPAFMALLEQQYSGKFDGGPAWWTSFNAVLAISHRRRVEEGVSADKDLAWGYAANALDTVLDILLRASQLMSVQALLILAWFFLGTPNPQPSFMLVANAIRLAHSIGLHRKGCAPSQSPIERATRVNVFWLAFALDRELSLRTGRPPAQDFGDFEVDLPDPLIQHKFSTHSLPNTNCNVFCAATQLSVIEAKLYSEMYLSEGLQPDSVAKATSLLNHDLQDWRAAFFTSFDTATDPELIKHASVVRLSYTYYHCIILVHRAQNDLDWTTRNSTASDGSCSANISDSIEHSLHAARSILKIGSQIPTTWHSLLWDVIPITVTAVIVTCLHALRRPSSTKITEDLRYVFDAVESLTHLGREATDSYLRPVTIACQSLYNAARGATKACINAFPENQSHGNLQTLASKRVYEGSQDVSRDTWESCVQMQEGIRTQRPEAEVESNLCSQNQSPDVGYAAWDQSLSFREMIPWEFDSLLGESLLEFLG